VKLVKPESDDPVIKLIPPPEVRVPVPLNVPDRVRFALILAGLFPNGRLQSASMDLLPVAVIETTLSVLLPHATDPAEPEMTIVPPFALNVLPELIVTFDGNVDVFEVAV
jgi:hypothetical protein